MLLELDDVFEQELGAAPKKKKATVKAKAKVTVKKPVSKPKPKPKSKKTQRKERRKKILSRKGSPALKKLGKGIAAVATGGASLAIQKLKNKKSAKKAVTIAKKAIQVAKKSPALAPKVMPIAKKAMNIAVSLPKAPVFSTPSFSAPIVGKAKLFKEKTFKQFSRPKKAKAKLAVVLDKVAEVSLNKAKPKTKRSKVKFNIFSKLKHLSKKLPVASKTRAKVNKRILMECRRLGPYS